MGRIDALRTLVMREAQAAGKTVDRFDVMFYLNEVELDVCQELLMLPEKKTIALVAGQSDYRITGNIYKIAEIQEPGTWLGRLHIVHDLNKWMDVQMDVNTGLSPATLALLGITVPPYIPFIAPNPQYGLLFKDKLTLFPAPIAAETLTLFCYMFPNAVVNDVGDPDFPPQWDRLLRYGVLSEILGGDWTIKYGAELIKMGGRTMKSTIKDVDRMESKFDIGF